MTLAATTELARCRVVLVRPRFAGNIGATARIMRNMGLTDLVLVAPEADLNDRQAQQLSTHGHEILDAAHVVGGFEDAVADCHFVVGSSARTGGPFRRQSVGPPEQIMPLLAQSLSTGRAALVLGPEPNGLTDAEVTRCHFVVTIPADPTYRALNLSHAAAICLYELRKAWLTVKAPAPAGESPASIRDLERMFERLQTALQRVHFLYGERAEPLMHAVRHLIGRARPTDKEVKVLLGLARQLNWFAVREQADSRKAADDRDSVEQIIDD